MSHSSLASSVSLPIEVSLKSLQDTANAQIPLELARLNQQQDFLGGLLSVSIEGSVRRTGPVTLQPAADGLGLLLSVPIAATFRAAPQGMANLLARDFGGAAVVRIKLLPQISPDWEASVRASTSYEWTDPLSVELWEGVKISVQSLVDDQVRGQLEQISAKIEQTVRQKANLRAQAGKLWARVQQPWKLPSPEPAYAVVRPIRISTSPMLFGPDSLKLTLGATFDLQAGLGKAPSTPPTPLPALNIAAPAQAGLDLTVPLRLPYTELSQIASKYAAQRPLVLNVPTQPTLQITQVRVSPKGNRLSVTVSTQITGPLGLRVRATTDMTGTPVLDPNKRLVTLQQLTVHTRKEGITGRVLAWLADERAQRYLSQAAQFQLGPTLEQARGQIQRRLPFEPASGVQISGRVQDLTLNELQVTPQALLLTAKVRGDLTAQVSPLK